MKFKFSFLVFFIVLALVMLTPWGVTQSKAESGSATLIVINYVGSELFFTLNDAVYRVPGVDVEPKGGQLTLSVSPGRHSFSGHVPGVQDTHRDLELSSGETEIIGVKLDRTAAVISPQGIVLQEPRDVVSFFEASLSPAAPTPEPTPEPLRPLPAGQGALVIDNYIGDELVLDILGVIYRVPPNGRRQINLSPDLIKYSAAAGYSGTAGEAEVAAGRYTGLGFNREIPPEELDYDVGGLKPTRVPLAMWTVLVDLSNEPVVEFGAAAPEPIVAPPALLPLSGAVTAPGNLRVVNYIGETLTFTINNQEYQVPAGDSKLSLELEPGEYTFTASTPRASGNNSVRVTAGETVQVSITVNLRGDRVEIYINP